MLAFIFVSTSSAGDGHYLLDLIPETIKEDASLREVVCDASNLMFVGTIGSVTSAQADATQRAVGGLPPVYSTVTYDVERMIGGNAQSQLVLLQPGGTVGSLVARASGHPFPEVGTRWMFALRYPVSSITGQPNFSVQNPLMLRFGQVSSSSTLPSQSDLVAAKLEYCDE